MKKPRGTRLVSHVFAAPRSRSWAKTRHVTTDAIQEVQWLSRLSKHINLHGKDLFINLYNRKLMPVLFGTKCIRKKKRILSKTKVVRDTKHAFALRLRVLMLIMILKGTFWSKTRTIVTTTFKIHKKIQYLA